MFYVGIDVGGTAIKGLAITAEGTILSKSSVSTGAEYGPDNVVKNIKGLVDELVKDNGTDYAVGVGCPGVIDSASGVVQFAGNLSMQNFPLAQKLNEQLGVPVKIVNDANAAALGEARFGASKGYQNSVLITLGTGVGAGIVLDGKLYEGSKSAGAEIGHMVIERHSENYCTCGRRGCFETFSSATALKRYTREKMKEHFDSAMWGKYSLENVSGKTAFEFCNVDTTARKVVDWYIDYLACGLTNVANIFRPDIILLGGGVSGEGENLTRPLQQKLDKEMLGGSSYAPVKVAIASLGNLAGSFGAAALNLS